MTDAAPTPPGSAEHDTLTPGTIFAGHRVEGAIGRGGMGIVYRARHLSLDRERALKVVAPQLSADQRFRERFKRESRLAAQIEHPNVIPVHHAGEESGQLYLAMRLVDGVDLRSLVADSGRLDPAHAVRMLAGVAAGLDAAHAGGLIHRDVKPANILVERDGDTERVFLTDFGISRRAGSDDSLTATGEFFGSVDYVAPEQIEGEPVDARTDVYALGGVLYFMLTGGPPFPRDTELAKLFAHANASRPRPSESEPGLPAAIDDVVAKAMAKRPDERYGSAGELVAAAAAALGEPAPALAPPVALPTQARAAADGAETRRLQRSRRRRLPLALAALAALAAAAAAGVLVLTSGDGSDGQPAGPQPELASIKVAEKPTGITVGGDRVWVASTDADVVAPIDPDRELAGKQIPIEGQPVSVAVGFGSVWVVNKSANTLIRLDPGSLAPAGSPIRVGDQPTDVAIGDRWVWVTNGDSATVSRVDPEINSVDASVHVGDSPRAVATGEGGVWVANIDDSSVSRINPRTAERIGFPIEVGQRPGDLAVGFGSVWVTDNYGGTVTRIDPDPPVESDPPRVDDPIRVGLNPRGVKTGFGYVWVANGGDDTVTRIDPETLAPAGSPIRVGKNPADIAVGLGAVWTADEDGSTVTRIRP